MLDCNTEKLWTFCPLSRILFPSNAKLEFMYHTQSIYPPWSVFYMTSGHYVRLFVYLRGMSLESTINQPYLAMFLTQATFQDKGQIFIPLPWQGKITVSRTVPVVQAHRHHMNQWVNYLEWIIENKLKIYSSCLTVASQSL